MRCSRKGMETAFLVILILIIVFVLLALAWFGGLGDQITNAAGTFSTRIQP